MSARQLSGLAGGGGLLRHGRRVLGLRVLRPRLLPGRAAAPARLADLSRFERHHGLLLRQRHAGGLHQRRHSPPRRARLRADRLLRVRNLCGGAALHRHAGAPVCRLPAHGGRLGHHERGRHHQHPGPVVRRQTRARHQPGAQRRQLQRRGRRAGAGVSRRRRGLYDRDAGRRRRNPRSDGAAGAQDSGQHGRRGRRMHRLQQPAAPTRPWRGLAPRPCAAQRSGACRRRFRSRCCRRPDFSCT